MLLMGIATSLQAQDATHNSTPAPEIIELTDGSTLHGKAHALSILKAHGVSFALNGLYTAN